ncbi:3' terminal RNA ribose 2'-O-methyltransferase Hen1 [Flindersiella endophytica]
MLDVLLTLTLTAPDDQTPATDLGYLLHKHPGKLQGFEATGGTAFVYYPQATAQRCTAALLFEVDPVGLVRRRKGYGENADSGFGLDQYVNDRPYSASSMFAVAMAKVFRTAMSGTCNARPELAARQLPLEVGIPALPCSGGGAELVGRLFEPLGWQVTAIPILADPEFADWGHAPYATVELTGTHRLADALKQLYVLLPVLDKAKHYWVGPEEVDKLIRAGGEWLADHPERELILRRYLSNKRRLVQTAIGRLAEIDDTEPEQVDNAVDSATITQVPLVERRHAAVKLELRNAMAGSVLDLGCGEGALLRQLQSDQTFTRITAVDVSARALEIAARRLKLRQLSDRQRERVTLFQSSLTYRDERLTGYDAAVLMEVIEHLDPERLPALEHNVFGTARPTTVIVTTPNEEYNVNYGALAAGEHRHHDHRFEWSRAQFGEWATRTADRYGYSVRFVPIGDEDPEHGPPTQMAVFTRTDETAGRAA